MGLRYDAEFIIVASFVLKGSTFEGMTADRALYNFNDGDSLSNIFTFPAVRNLRSIESEDGGRTAVNVCQKPVELMRFIVNRFSKEDENVLDLCSGTGTTAVAALTCNRSVISVENNEFQATQCVARIVSLAQIAEVEVYAETGRLPFKANQI